jgi:hypothetical protein
MAFMKFNHFLSILAIVTLLSACATPRPNNVNNICGIFKQYPKWYWATKEVEKRWHVPVSVQMAIIYQESRFQATAQPARTKLLGFIPWTRPSTAYGYTQALDSTWARYKKSVGGFFSSRDEFSDAVDFIGWYAYKAHRRAGIPRNNAYKLYLAYHEGVGGYERRTYLKKPWLMQVAKKVKKRADLYHVQLTRCQSQLKRKPWYHFW